MSIKVAVPETFLARDANCQDFRNWVFSSVYELLPEELRKGFEKLDLIVTRKSFGYPHYGRTAGIQVGFTLYNENEKLLRRVLIDKNGMFDFGKLVEKIQEVVPAHAGAIASRERKLSVQEDDREKQHQLNLLLRETSLKYKTNVRDNNLVINNVARWPKEKQEELIEFLVAIIAES